MKILIDTCAWIDFLRAKDGALGDQVAQAIELGNAVLCDVVIAELLQGAKGDKEKSQLQFLFETVDKVDVINEDWVSAGLILQELRQKGFTLPLTDGLIAAVAKRNSLPVLTIDKHFQYLPVTTSS